MKKRCFSVLLAVCLLLLPLSEAAAAPSAGSHQAGHTGWTAITSALPAGAGSYYLTGDIDLSAAWTVPSGTVDLCLNGHVIRQTNPSERILSIPAGSTLNLYDCDAAESHMFRDDGAGLWILDPAGNHKLSGGVLTGGTGVENNGSLSLQGGSIVGGNGGGVTVGAGAALQVSGAPVVKHNLSGGQPCNIRLSAGTAVTVTGMLTDGASLGITPPSAPTDGSPVAFAAGAPSGLAKYFRSDNSSFDVIQNGGSLQLALAKAHVHTVSVDCAAADGVTFTRWDKTDRLPTAAGNYVLAGDVDLSGTWSVPTGIVNLCLNGHIIRQTAQGKGVVLIPAGAALYLCDCIKTGQVTGGDSADNGGGVSVTGNGRLHLYGGKISGNSAKTLGGGVYLRSGVFQLFGGEVSGNTAGTSGNRGYGGGIAIFQETGGAAGTFTMLGGEVKDNTATYGAGGILVSRNGRFAMSGGSVTGNTGGTDGGVAVLGSISLSGSVNITGNTLADGATPSDVILPSTDSVIKIAGPLTTGTSVGVTVSQARTFTSGWNAVMGATNPVHYFTANQNSNYYITLSNKEAAMTARTAGPSFPVTPDAPQPDNNSGDCPQNATCPIGRFTDASPTAWYHDGVHYCLEKSLMAGTSDTTFSPASHTNRSMIAAILWRMAGKRFGGSECPYSDVKENSYYFDAVIWADKEGFVMGYGNGKFGPEDPITREQLAVILWRYAGSPEASGDLEDFTDGASASEWAVPALRWATEKGILSGKVNGVLDPAGHATRSEAASMLQRFSGLE